MDQNNWSHLDDALLCQHNWSGLSPFEISNHMPWKTAADIQQRLQFQVARRWTGLPQPPIRIQAVHNLEDAGVDLGEFANTITDKNTKYLTADHVYSVPCAPQVYTI